MSLAIQFLLFISLFLVFAAYIVFPIVLYLLYIKRNKSSSISDFEDYRPHLSCIISIYNEEKVIEQKIQSLLHQNYPSDQITIYIGSDCSNDHSHEIIQRIASIHSNVHLIIYQERRGKTAVVNDLISYINDQNKNIKEQIYLLTDASVILDQNCVKNLIKHFSNPKVGLVDSKMTPVAQFKADIAQSEKQYIQLETYLKYWEGELWGQMMGAFGGCYAVRASLMPRVPKNLLVDDFYIGMKILESGYQSKNSMDAIAYEALPGSMEEEFRRKVRISTGNFQNLKYFSHFLYTGSLSRIFCFTFHKFIRWITPLLILISILSSIYLFLEYGVYYGLIFAFLVFVFFLIPAIDRILKLFNIKNSWIRNISYFSLMNFALLKGFIQYCKGVSSGIWQPTSRK